MPIATASPLPTPSGRFKGTSGLADLGLESPPARENGPKQPGVLVPQTYVPAFRSLLQGDHLGVEFALEGHSQLLAAHHALLPAARVQGSAMLPLGPTWQALVIDDLVNMCALPATANPAGPSEARTLHLAAERAYETHQVEGSPAKDVLGSTLFQAIGAEVDSRGPQVSRACVPVAAPLGRRVALAVLSLRAARLPITSPRLLSRLSWCGSLGHPSGPIAAEAAARGLRVGPPIHCTGSPRYAIEDPDFSAWLYATLKEGRILALVVLPTPVPQTQDRARKACNNPRRQVPTSSAVRPAFRALLC